MSLRDAGNRMSGINFESGSESLSVLSDSLQPHGLYIPWNSPGQNTEVGSLSLPQGILLTQGSNPGLWHCRRILYQLSYKGSPRVLEWVAYPFSRVLPDPGIEPGSPALQADSLPTELSGNLIHWQNLILTTETIIMNITVIAISKWQSK